MRLKRDVLVVLFLSVSAGVKYMQAGGGKLASRLGRVADAVGLGRALTARSAQCKLASALLGLKCEGCLGTASSGLLSNVCLARMSWACLLAACQVYEPS